MMTFECIWGITLVEFTFSSYVGFSKDLVRTFCIIYKFNLQRFNSLVPIISDMLHGNNAVALGTRFPMLCTDVQLLQEINTILLEQVRSLQAENSIFKRSAALGSKICSKITRISEIASNNVLLNEISFKLSTLIHSMRALEHSRKHKSLINSLSSQIL